MTFLKTTLFSKPPSFGAPKSKELSGTFCKDSGNRRAFSVNCGVTFQVFLRHVVNILEVLSKSGPAAFARRVQTHEIKTTPVTQL